MSTQIEMSTRIEPGSGDTFVAALSRQRLELLHRSSHLVKQAGDALRTADDRGVAELSALLATSLEELKVVEDELLDRHESLDAVRAELEAEIRTARRLFDLAPASLVVTDLVGGIIEANRAAATLLRRECDRLERKPLAAFIPRAERADFRERLARLSIVEGVFDWRFTMQPTGEQPVCVSAAVHVVRNVGERGTAALYWSLRPVAASEAD
jgi:PAS domain-containing protein